MNTTGTTNQNLRMVKHHTDLCRVQEKLHKARRIDTDQLGVCLATPPLYICITRLRYVCICVRLGFGQELVSRVASDFCSSEI